MRAVTRFGTGTNTNPCLPNSGFDDHDDLIFTVNPVSGTELVKNGTFATGLTNWLLWEPPDIVHNSAAGAEFRYHRANPTTTTSGQAVIFQETGASVGAGTPLTATFDLGNGDVVRKRIAVLVIDSDFTDLSVCTFWLPANAPMRNYQMKTHATKGWNNAAIYFYASSDGLGDYRLDNVSLKPDAAGSSTQTTCVDPTAPAAGTGTAGPNLLTNGDFSAGTIAPWGAFFNLNFQLTGGVLEFNRPAASTNGPGVLQSTNQAMPANQVLTASFKLGNSSSVRKRVTVILHDIPMTNDLAACTFWLIPNQPLSTYTMRSFTTTAWTNATISFYAASVGTEQWSRLDDVTFQRAVNTPAVSGTECVEPAVLGVDAPLGGVVTGRSGSTGGGVPRVPTTGGGVGPAFAPSQSASSADTYPGWRVEAWTRGRAILEWAEPIEITKGDNAHLTFASWLTARASTAEVQVSDDGVTWETLAEVPPSDNWSTIAIDLSQLAPRTVHVRFVFTSDGAPAGVLPDVWMIDDVTIVTTQKRLAGG